MGDGKNGAGPRATASSSCFCHRASGLPCGSLAGCLDNTADCPAALRRRASDRLRQSVLDALPTQIAVLDPGGRIIAVNRAWREFAEENGGPEALREAIGLNYLAACRQDGRDSSGEALLVANGIREVIERQRPGFSVEYSCHSSQQQRWFLMRATPLDGELEGVVVAHFDITERSLAEEDARRARDTLTQVARLNAVGILASSLVHEMLQPLSSASFYCSAASQLAQGPAADPARLVQVIERIEEQVQRAGGIMERLRAFLRGREMRKIALPLGQICRRSFEFVQWFVADNGVQLRLVAPAVLPEIRVDPVQIEQVLVNLICNAVQAIDVAGSTRREVTVEVVPRAAEIEIIVSDTGPGLPSGRREVLFDIFGSTNDSSLGLGLAISRYITEAHGGRLWAEEDPAEGAVFHVTLPIMAAEAHPSASAPSV